MGCRGSLQVYIIEANPRASRTVPFVAKAVGHPIVKYASLLMAGKTLPEIGFTEEPKLGHVAVKEAVLPFDKFPGASAGATATLAHPTCAPPTPPGVLCGRRPAALPGSDCLRIAPKPRVLAGKCGFGRPSAASTLL